MHVRNIGKIKIYTNNGQNVKTESLVAVQNSLRASQTDRKTVRQTLNLQTKHFTLVYNPSFAITSSCICEGCEFNEKNLWNVFFSFT